MHDIYIYAGRVWYNYQVNGIIDLCFKLSELDECIFYYSRGAPLVYVHGSLSFRSDDEQLQKLTTLLSKKFKIQEEGAHDCMSSQG